MTIEGLFATTKSGIELTIHLIPGAKKEQILGIIETEKGKALKISIHEKPTENKANEALIKFLAEKFDIPKSNISIKRGLKSRDKRISVDGITVEKMHKILWDYLKFDIG